VMAELRVWLGPDRPVELVAAIERAGGRLAVLEEANIVVWSASGSTTEDLRALLHDGIEFVQLDSAGVEHWFGAQVIDNRRAWAAAQGVYSDGVAEHALAFLLAAAKRFPQAARARSWSAVAAGTLEGATIGIVGAGGIGRRLIEFLTPFGVTVLALTRSGREVAGADRSFGPQGLHALLEASDYVVLGAALTPQTRRLIGSLELDLIGPEGGLVNYARGGLLDTDALVAALREGRLGVACLDVTDPEPLPDGHPLWDLPNALVTPHVSHAWGDHFVPLAARVEANLRRYADGHPLEGAIDPADGY
jgi:phosphoglycerate dehydrogenase-like enzyme